MKTQSVQLIGLGRMGLGVGSRLSKVCRVDGYDPSSEARGHAKEKGIERKESLAQLASSAPAGKRVYWLLVPAGMVDDVLGDPALSLSSGDIVIEAGNSNYKQSIRRSEKLKERGVHFLDVGTSGGVWGEREGFCLMVGGDAQVFQSVEDLFRAVSTKEGLLYVGPRGSGHFVKMVHNAIEYGMLQVLGEGFSLLNCADSSVGLDEIAELWNHGSVIRSWLLELTARALEDSKGFASISGKIGGGETGTWAVEEAQERKISTPLIQAALEERLRSKTDENFAHRLVAALRQQFGGHEVVRK